MEDKKIKISVPEVLRYLGAGKNAPEELRRMVSDTAARLENMIQPRYIYKILNLYRDFEKSGGLRIGDMILRGNSARMMLEQCDRAVLLLCTLGMEFENMLRAAQARDMTRAVILDACGSAFVESGCDAAEDKIKRELNKNLNKNLNLDLNRDLKKEYFLTDRFSPGYGDLELNLQKEICNLLDGTRRLGVYVTESYMLNPSKSVTAVIGISDRKQAARIRGCAYCILKESCAYRKTGKSCKI